MHLKKLVSTATWAVVCSGLAVASGCKSTGGSGIELATGCHLAVGPNRRALAYLTDEAVTRKMGGQEVSLPFARPGCLEKGKTADQLTLSKDGKFALVVGGESRGFNPWESVPYDLTVSCLVDFERREAKQLDALIPADELANLGSHGRFLMSPRRQVAFAWGTADRAVRVVDMAGGRSALLSLPASDGCDLVEVDQRALLACPGFIQASAGDYQHSVSVHPIDLQQWPPVALEPRRIPVAAGLNGVAWSRDGRLLAYWGHGFGRYGDFPDLYGVMEFASGKRLFENRETRYAYTVAMEFAPDGKSVLLGEGIRGGGRGEKIGADKRGLVSRLDLSGKRLGSRELKDPPQRIYWMDDGFLCDLGCRAVKLEAF